MVLEEKELTVPSSNTSQDSSKRLEHDAQIGRRSSSSSHDAAYSVISGYTLKREFERGALEASGEESLDVFSRDDPNFGKMLNMIVNDQNRPFPTEQHKRVCAELSQNSWMSSEDSAESFGRELGKAEPSGRSQLLLLKMLLESKAATEEVCVQLLTLRDELKKSTQTSGSAISSAPKLVKFTESSAYLSVLRNGYGFVFSNLGLIGFWDRKEKMSRLKAEPWFMNGISNADKDELFNEETENGRSAVDAVLTVLVSKIEQVKKRMKVLSFGNDTEKHDKSVFRTPKGVIVFNSVAMKQMWPKCLLGQV